MIFYAPSVKGGMSAQYKQKTLRCRLWNCHFSMTKNAFLLSIVTMQRLILKARLPIRLALQHSKLVQFLYCWCGWKQFSPFISLFTTMIESSIHIEVTCPKIQVEKTMKSPIYVYYQLTNYFQNHRRYAQFTGKILSPFLLNVQYTGSCIDELFCSYFIRRPCFWFRLHKKKKRKKKAKRIFFYIQCSPI